MASTTYQTSESFHRNKRTFLLFAAGLLITRIPGIDVTGHSGLLGVSLENVDIDLVRWLLFGPALYYFAGVLLDYWTDTHANIDANGQAFADFQAALVETTSKIKGLRIQSDAELHSEAQELIRDAESSWQGALQQLKGFLAEDPVRTETVDTFVNYALQEFNTGLHSARRRATIYGTRDYDWEDRLASIDKSLRRLRNSITWSARVRFMAWDLGGAAVIMLAAIAALPVFNAMWARLGG